MLFLILRTFNVRNVCYTVFGSLRLVIFRVDVNLEFYTCLRFKCLFLLPLGVVPLAIIVLQYSC